MWWNSIIVPTNVISLQQQQLRLQWLLMVNAMPLKFWNDNNNIIINNHIYRAPYVTSWLWKSVNCSFDLLWFLSSPKDALDILVTKSLWPCGLQEFFFLLLFRFLAGYHIRGDCTGVCYILLIGFLLFILVVVGLVCQYHSQVIDWKDPLPDHL